MAAKFIFILSLTVAASALPVLPYNKVVYAESEAPAYYQFEYSVQDKQSGDVKQQKEIRDGDAVQGSYSLVQPDGVQRIVDYSSNKQTGFNAVVRYEGQPIVQPANIAYAAAPAYTAPIAKVAYATPVAKIAYNGYNAATLTQVTFSSSALSYSH